MAKICKYFGLDYIEVVYQALKIHTIYMGQKSFLEKSYGLLRHVRNQLQIIEFKK